MRFAFLQQLVFSKCFQLKYSRNLLGANVFVFGAGDLRFKSLAGQVCHLCDISSKGAVLLKRNDAEMGPTNSLHTLA